MYFVFLEAGYLGRGWSFQCVWGTELINEVRQRFKHPEYSKEKRKA